MALETLKSIKQIGIYNVKEVEWNQPSDHLIEINHKHNAITFKIQNGPIKEHGINGCQVDTMIKTAKIIIEGLNKKFPCRENAMVITKLDEALMWSEKRKQDRINRNVEGVSKN